MCTTSMEGCSNALPLKMPRLDRRMLEGNPKTMFKWVSFSSSTQAIQVLDWLGRQGCAHPEGMCRLSPQIKTYDNGPLLYEMEEVPRRQSHQTVCGNICIVLFLYPLKHVMFFVVIRSPHYLSPLNSLSSIHSYVRYKIKSLKLVATFNR